MKKFKVYAMEECSWYKIIEAESEEQAREKGYRDISENSYENWHVGTHGVDEITDILEIK